MHILERAMKAAGADTQAAFAAALGKFNDKGEPAQSYVSMLFNRVVKKGRPIPLEICPKIEEATGGEVTCHDLRPDFFGPTKARNQGANA